MIQIFLVILLVSGAIFYLARKAYLNLSGKDTPGCEKCAANELSRKHH